MGGQAPSHLVTEDVQGCTHLSSHWTCQDKQPALYPSYVVTAVSRLCHLLTQVSNSEQNIRRAEGREVKKGRQEKGTIMKCFLCSGNCARCCNL